MVTKHMFETRSLPGEFAEAESAPDRLPHDQGLSELVLDVLKAVEKRAQAELPPDPASG